MLPAPLARFFIKLIDFKPLKGLTPIPDRAVITTAQHTAKTDGINIILLLYSRYMNRQTNRSQIVFKVKRDETVKGFKGLCDGDYDHLPEPAFYMVGTIEDAVKKAEKLAADAA